MTAPFFAGNLMLTLAQEGRLVIDPRVADRTISSLEQTLAQVHDRLRLLDSARRSGKPADECTPQAVIDAQFAEQLQPGCFELAAVELPKYIEAVRRARRR